MFKKITIISACILLAVAGFSGITTAAHDTMSYEESKDISNETTDLGDLKFGDNGSYMIVTGGTEGIHYQYKLSTPYDINTATYSGEFDPGSSAGAFTFNNNGTKMYSRTSSSSAIYSYTLAEPYNITTSTGSSNNWNLGNNVDRADAYLFNDDGTMLYVMDYNSDIHRYELPTPYDINTMNHLGVVSASAAAPDSPGSIYDMSWNNDGTRLYMVDSLTEKLYKFSVPNPYDASSLTHLANTDISTESPNPQGIDFGNGGGDIFIGSNGDEDIDRYSISVPNTVSGTVTDTETGDTIQGVNVIVKDNNTGGIEATTKTNSNGEYSIDIPEGSYNITYENDLYVVSKWTNIHVDSDTTLDMALQRLYLGGKVTDTDGNAIQGASIEIYNGSNDLYNETETDSNGEYQVWVYDDTWSVYVEHEDYFNQNETGIVLENETQTVNGPLAYDASFQLQEKPSESLHLIVRGFVEANETVPYRVEYVRNGGTKIVTNQATVSVGNSSVLDLDTQNNTITGLNVNDTTNMTVSYQGIETLNVSKDITVATTDVSNIGILPLNKKIFALLWDRTVQVIFLATFAGLGMSRVMQNGGFGAGRANNQNPWILLGVCFMIIMLAGVRDYVSTGIVFSAFFYVALAGMLMKGVNKDQVNVVNEGGFNE